MKRNLLFFALIISLCHSFDIFVTPIRSCGTSCTGMASQPFDNLFLALKESTKYEQTTIRLLFDSSAHFLMLKELHPTTNAVLYDYEGQFWNFSLRNVTIQPLFCDEPIASTTFPTKCISRSLRMVIYPKTTRFSFLIKANLTLQNLVFYASEDIRNWNIDSTTLQNCLYKRTNCCSTIIPSTLVTSIYCGSKTLSIDQKNMRTNTSLFILDASSTDSITPSLNINFVSFRCFLSPHLDSIIRTKNQNFNISITRGFIDKSLLGYGFIYHSQDSQDNNGSSIFINATNFTNYNPLGYYDTKNPRSEGYLLYAPYFFSGTLNIIQSMFSELSVSTRSVCYPQYYAYYTSPMTYFANITNTFTRSDIWKQYHQDHRNKTFMSSLMFFSKLSGSIAINNSSFANVLGTSGSVLSVADVSSSKTWITIYNTIFDSNVAYDGFANLLIVKNSNPQFARMLSCPHIEVVNSTFKNAYGCPGTYGNVAFLCYWDSSPPLSTARLSSYDFSEFKTSDYSGPNLNSNTLLSDFLAEESEEYAYIVVKNSTFTNNQLALSNCLAVVGSYFTVLEENVFQDSGGTTQGIACLRLKNSYFWNRYGSAYFPCYGFYGQATAVYFDRFVKLKFRNNVFSSNWGPWDGSTALGSSLTIKNRLQIAGTLQFQNDVFKNHNGVPDNINQNLTVGQPNDRRYQAPLITVSDDLTGSSAVQEKLTDASLLLSALIMNGVVFDSNIINYDYDAQNSYSLAKIDARSANLLRFSLRNSERFRTGLIKFLNSYEAIDNNQVSFVSDSTYNSKVQPTVIFKNGVITNNTLKSKGCLLATLSMRSYLLHSLTISSNKIRPTGSPTVESANFYASFYTSLNDAYTGLFCSYYTDSVEDIPYSQITSCNLTISDNYGTIFFLHPQNKGRLYLTESILRNNTGQNSALIVSYTNSKTFLIKNAFLSNNYVFGITLLLQFVDFVGVSNTYLKNDGLYASILYSQNPHQGFEVGARLYQNTVSPKDKMRPSTSLPKAGLYRLDVTTSFEFFACEFSQNKVYSGLITSYNSNVKFSHLRIVDNPIFGISVLGTSSINTKLEIYDTQILNSSLTIDPSIGYSHGAIIYLNIGSLRIQNLLIIDSKVQGDGTVLFANTADISIQNISFINVLSDLNTMAFFILSRGTIENFFCQNITSLFTFTETSIQIKSISVQGLQATNNAQSLFSMYNSSLYAWNLTYTQNLSSENSQVPLIEASNSIIHMDQASFSNLLNQKKSTIFSLTNNGRLSIKNSLFESMNAKDLTIVKATSINIIDIRNCLFQTETAIILNAVNIRDAAFFISNTVFTNSKSQNLFIQNSSTNYIFDNLFLPAQNDDSFKLLDFTNIFAEPTITIIDSGPQTTFLDNILISQEGQDGVIQVISNNYPYNLTFTNNYLINNAGYHAGALYLASTQQQTNLTIPAANIQRSVFVKNRAMDIMSTSSVTGRGAAIHLTSTHQTPQITNISNQTIFINNAADKRGGAVYFDYSPPFIKPDNVFQNNFAASQLNHIGSYPVRLQQPNKNFNPNYVFNPSKDNPPTTTTTSTPLSKWNDIVSGVIFENNYTFVLLDMFGQLVYDDQSSFLNLYLASDSIRRDRTEFSNLLSIQAQNGSYTFNNFIFNYQPDSLLNITLESTEIPSFPNFLTLPSLDIQVSFRKCSLGEYEVGRNGSAIGCQPCQAGFWQPYLQHSNQTCEPCDSKSTYCFGGNQVGPKQGFWRMNQTADLVLECLKKEACKGNLVLNGITQIPKLNPVGECTHGYQGNLCENCIANWAKADTGECVDCKKNIFYYFQFVLVCILNFILILIAVKGSLNFLKSRRNTETLSKENIALLSRLLVNYLQLLSLIKLLPIPWSNFNKIMLSKITLFSSIIEPFFNIDCLLILTFDINTETLMFYKNLFSFVSPFVFMLFGILCAKLFTKQYFLLTLITILGYNTHFSTIRNNALLFDCRNIYRRDSPLLYLTHQYNIECWKGQHLQWIYKLAIPSLVIWLILVPCIALGILIKYRRQASSKQVLARFGFLYFGYRKERFYWEFVVLTRKLLLLTSLIVLDFDSLYLKIYLFLTILVFSYIIQVRMHPYANNELNQLEQISLLSAGTICFCGLYFVNSKRNQVLDIVINALCIAGTLIFCVKFLKLCIEFYYRKSYKKLRSFKTAANFSKRVCPWLKRLKKQGTALKSVDSKTNTLSARIPTNIPLISIPSSQRELIRSKGEYSIPTSPIMSFTQPMSPNPHFEDINSQPMIILKSDSTPSNDQ